jgi:hypothetical protein
MDETTAENTIRWYEDLEEALAAFLKGVPPQGNNLQVWSPKLATVLVEACTLTESVFYQITPISTAVGGMARDRMGLVHYAELYAARRRFAERKVALLQEPLRWVEPFRGWAGRTAGFSKPDWWKTYEAAKHHRLDVLQEATLHTALLALAGALVTIVTEPALLLMARRHKWLDFYDDRPESLVTDVLERRTSIWLCPETQLFSVPLGRHCRMTYMS